MSDKTTLLKDTIQKANQLAEEITTNTLGTSKALLKGVVQEIVQESLSADVINSETNKTQVDNINEMGDMDLQPMEDIDLDDDTEIDYDSLPDLGMDSPSEDMDYEMEDGGEAIDMTDMGDGDDFVKAFKKMNPETITVDNGLTKINDPETGAEYIITNEGEKKQKVKLIKMIDETITPEGENETVFEIKLESEDTLNEDAEIIYEIELEDDSNLSEMATTAFKHKAPVATNASREKVTKNTKRIGSNKVFGVKPPTDSRTSAKKKTTRVRGDAGAPNALGKGDSVFNKKAKMREGVKQRVESVIRENKFLKNKLNKLEENMPKFENKLNEFKVSNTVLTYALKLIAENVTTANEKQNIVTQFSEVTTIKEAQNLYKQFQTKLSGAKVNDITTAPELNENVKGSSAVITEGNSTNPELDRMKNLIKY